MKQVDWVMDDDWKTDVCRNRHRGAEESVGAFERLDTTRSRVAVFEALKHAGSFGATCNEVAELFGTTPNAISGRFTELKARGLIRKAGRRLTKSGNWAGVYVRV